MIQPKVLTLNVDLERCWQSLKAREDVGVKQAIPTRKPRDWRHKRENVAGSVANGREEGSGTQRVKANPRSPESQGQELKPMLQQIRNSGRLVAWLQWYSESVIRQRLPRGQRLGKVRRTRVVAPTGAGWTDNSQQMTLQRRETSRFLS